jgi:hypothetical protein
MNYNEKILKFIESLINLTDKQKIQWMPISDYMDISKNRSLKRYLVDKNSYLNSIDSVPIIEEHSSYVGTVGGGQVYLFTFVKTKYIRLNAGIPKVEKEYSYISAMQVNSLKDIVILSEESKFQEELKTLKDKINGPNIQSDYFLDSIIKFSDENQ